MKRTRIALIILQLLVAVNAIGGGVYGLSGGAKSPFPPPGSRESPFHSYTIPSLFLLIVIGGGMLIVATAAWSLATQRCPVDVAGDGLVADGLDHRSGGHHLAASAGCSR